MGQEQGRSLAWLATDNPALMRLQVPVDRNFEEFAQTLQDEVGAVDEHTPL
mgnify:CR=1 FL=1